MQLFSCLIAWFVISKNALIKKIIIVKHKAKAKKEVTLSNLFERNTKCKK